MTKHLCLKHPSVSEKALFFLFFLLNLTVALDYPCFNGYQILDLSSKDIDSFYLETQKWTVSGLRGTTNSSLCGTNNPLLGGYGILSTNANMSRTYSALPTHSAIYYEIEFNFIDKFKVSDYFTLKLDSTSISGGSSLSTYNSYLTTSTCGASDPDTTQFTITGSMPHTANTVTFQIAAKVATGLNSGTFGIRDLQLTFVNDNSVTTATSCFRVFDSQLLGLSGECSCVKGSYSDSGTCTTCDPACQNCFGSSASECFACAAGYSFTGSQCIKCDSSCLTCTGPGSLQCVTCQDGYWLQPNGSCTATCDLPASASQVVGSLQLCFPACTTNQFVLWDGTCTNDCSSPLVISQSTSGGFQLCNKPCENNEFLYSNGSCLSTCPSPFQSSSSMNVDLCQSPCTNSQFLDPSGSCSSACPTPLIASIPADGIKRCSSPCPNLSDYYYSINMTCGDICSLPSVLQPVEFIQVCSVASPSSALSSDDKNSVDKAKDATSGTGKAASVGIAASSLISSQSSGAITLVSLIKMLEYIRYMNINYPPKLEYMLDSQGNDQISLNLNVNLPQSIEREFPDYPLPGKFGRYNLVSNFFVNYWQELLTLGVVFLVLGVSSLLASRAKDVKYIGICSTKIRDIIKWNFFLIIFCGNVDSVGVYSSMEFRTTHFNSFVSVFATLVCVFVNLLVLCVMLMIPYIIYSLRRKSNKVLPFTEEIAKLEDTNRFMTCGVLFMNFREKLLIQHSCMFLILLRVYLFNLVIGYFFEYPLAQAIFLTTMSVIMLTYFSIARPYKNSLELLKTMTYESIIAVVNICVLILAIMDHRGIEDTESRRKLGDVVIISNMIFNAMAVFYMVVELIIKTIKVYRRRKTITAKGWRFWLTITTFMLEPEELEMEGDETPQKAEPCSQKEIKGAMKLEEKLPSDPKKRVSFKFEPPSPSDDQKGGQDSDTPPDRISPSLTKISTIASRFTFNKGRTLKINSIVSLNGFNDVGSKTLLGKADTRPSMLFSQDHLSPRGNLLQNPDNLSVPPSPRMLLRGSSRPSMQDLENKFMNESLSPATPVKSDEEKGILLQKVQSYEVNSSQNKERRRNFRPLGPSSAVLDGSGSSPDLSFEVGTATLSILNTPRRQQSRFSRYSPEKSKIFPEEDDA